MDYLIILFIIVSYFLPSIVGWNCKKSGGIIILNLLLGWTLIGWVAALIWGITGETIKK